MESMPLNPKSTFSSDGNNVFLFRSYESRQFRTQPGLVPSLNK